MESQLKRLQPMSSAPDTGDSPGGTEAEYYTWTEPKSHVLIQNLSSSAATMYIRLNGTQASDASTTAWDVVLAPGDPPFANGGEFDVKAVAVYFDDAATLGTDFSIKGW